MLYDVKTLPNQEYYIANYIVKGNYIFFLGQIKQKKNKENKTETNETSNQESSIDKE